MKSKSIRRHLGNRGARTSRGIRGNQLHRRPGQFGRVGVETEADLAAALIYERRQPIGKGGQRISRP
jgi:hypothetical protein